MGRKKLIDGDETIVITIRIPSSWRNELSHGDGISNNVRRLIEQWINHKKKKRKIVHLRSPIKVEKIGNDKKKLEGWM